MSQPASLSPPASPAGIDTRAGGERFALLATTRHLTWVALGLAAVLALASPLVWMQLLAGGAALVLGLATALLRLRRPVLVVDDSGYRVEVAGRVRFAVHWDELRRVLRDRAEEALYLDCGERSRNLFLPPRAGFAFTFTNRERLFRLLDQKVGDRAEDVPRFDRSLAAPAAPVDVPAASDTIDRHGE